MVLVPPELDDISRLTLLDRVHTLLGPVGFGSFSVATPEAHDRTIAFTSQLAHVVSNAYVKSPTAQEHHGFSAEATVTSRAWRPQPAHVVGAHGENADNLRYEVTTIIDALTAYRDALDARDTERLRCSMPEATASSARSKDEREV